MPPAASPSKRTPKTAAQTPPRAILDALKGMENPHRQKVFDAGAASDGPPVPGADLDYEHALKFLYGYNGSTATFNAYRREIERLLQWSWRVERRAVHTLAREDIEDFVRFSLSPPPAWIGTVHAPRFVIDQGERKPNPKWRPFVVSVAKTDARNGTAPDAKRYQPGQAAVRATFAALSSFYDYLTEEKVVSANPVALIRQKSKFIRRDHDAAVVRRISNLQWAYVLETAEHLADAHPQTHERTLFIMNCLFALYLRISELVADERSSPVMGDFRKDQDGNWWFHVTGKGNKDRTVTVSDAMIDALRRYRIALGLSPLPALNDRTPLVAKARGGGPVTSTRQIRRIVQDCFDAAFARMCEDGLGEDAAELRAATVHWLRHTGISEDVKTRPREHVRDDAGHASMATTDRYIESDRRERHASARKKPLRDL